MLANGNPVAVRGTVVSLKSVAVLGVQTDASVQIGHVVDGYSCSALQFPYGYSLFFSI
jgi:hypothetical protein